MKIFRLIFILLTLFYMVHEIKIQLDEPAVFRSCKLFNNKDV